jgi:hypothetical protein
LKLFGTLEISEDGDLMFFNEQGELLPCQSLRKFYTHVSGIHYNEIGRITVLTLHLLIGSTGGERDNHLYFNLHPDDGESWTSWKKIRAHESQDLVVPHPDAHEGSSAPSLCELLRMPWHARSDGQTWETRATKESLELGQEHLREVLQGIGYELVPISGEGNLCQFRAIAAQLNQLARNTGADALHTAETVRDQVLLFLRNVRTQFRSFHQLT